jgi:3-methyl-2-oxobutanoate hydroxymethyltransferase
VLGMFETFTPKFAKKYVNLNKMIREAITQYRQEVLDCKFPGEEHSYGMSDEVLETIKKEFGKAE